MISVVRMEKTTSEHSKNIVFMELRRRVVQSSNNIASSREDV